MFLGEDEALYLLFVFTISFLLEMVEVDEEECQRCKPLLAIDNKPFAVSITDNNRAKEVMPVMFNFCPNMSFLVTINEFCLQIF